MLDALWSCAEITQLCEYFVTFGLRSTCLPIPQDPRKPVLSLGCRHAGISRFGGAKIGDAAKKAAELSFLFLRKNRVPIVLISFRNRFLALAPAIAGG